MALIDMFHNRALARTSNDVRTRAATKKTDISDHLETLFLESLDIDSKLIVELGVGDGESTFVLERVARFWGATLVSVDIEDCRDVSSYGKRTFVKQDDISFAGIFEGWCKERMLVPRIDILFIDTSHLYDHTVAEIKSWFPFLAARTKVFFHDTNMKAVFVRKDGTTGQGWDNERGVIRAVEEYFHTAFDESSDFSAMLNGWLIRHYAICNGFLVMEKYG
jgi:cephalosporin hydroxylase